MKVREIVPGAEYVGAKAEIRRVLSLINQETIQMRADGKELTPATEADARAWEAWRKDPEKLKKPFDKLGYSRVGGDVVYRGDSGDGEVPIDVFAAWAQRRVR